DRPDQEDDVPFLATDGMGVWLSTWSLYEIDNNACCTFDIKLAQSTDNGASWTPPGSIGAVTGVPYSVQQSPQVAADGAGHWLATWDLSVDDNGAGIVVARGSTCGNGIVEFGKQCDDGNRIDGDGCSSTCQNEFLSGAHFMLRGSAPGATN